MKMEYVNVNGYLIPKLENGPITDNIIGKYGMMYNLTGDFYAVSQILGHSVDDFSQQMGVNLKINTVTTRYVQVQEQRKLSVLTAYHQAVFATPKNAAVGDNSL